MEVNLIINVFFFLEIIIKLVGLGFKRYFSEFFNCIDVLVVGVRMVDFGFELSGNPMFNSYSVTALRAFRILRVFKLAKHWQPLTVALRTISLSINEFGVFSILLFIIMFIYSLLGLELFSQTSLSLNDGDMSFSRNFNNFVNAFVTVFVVLTNDGWSKLYTTYYRENGAITATAYFISLIIFGQWIMRHLFQAVLLQNFDHAYISEQVKHDREEYYKKRNKGEDDEDEVPKKNIVIRIYEGMIAYFIGKPNAVADDDMLEDGEV